LKSIKGIFLVFLALMLASCSSQRKLATEFITRQADIHVLLLPPPAVLKKYYPIHPDSLASGQVDPFDLEESKFIKDAQDSVLVLLFMTSLRENLEAFDVKVYGPADVETFLSLDSSAYVFSIAQLEIMEYLNEEIRYAVLDTTVYEVGFARVNLNHSQWFEFTELNHPERPMQVLFSSQFSSDVFDGRFRQNILTGEMFYEFQPYRLRFEDLHQLSVFAGQKNAQFIFDFLLNKYIDDRSKKPRQVVDYLQYDRERHSIRRAFNDRFIRIAISNSD
jgi:hypothetical protein